MYISTQNYFQWFPIMLPWYTSYISIVKSISHTQFAIQTYIFYSHFTTYDHITLHPPPSTLHTYYPATLSESNEQLPIESHFLVCVIIQKLCIIMQMMAQKGGNV